MSRNAKPKLALRGVKGNATAGQDKEKHSGLGRGLGALLGGGIDSYEETAAAQPEQRAAGVQQLPVDRIVANPFQPRQRFDTDKLQELVESVKEHGVLQPLLVRRHGDRYELAAGERRLRAARAAGLTKVPVLVKEYDDAAMREVALVENIQRHNLNPMEEAEGLKALMQAGSLTQEQVAAKVGRSRAAVANILRLLKLAPAVRQAVAAEQLTMGQVRPLLTLDSDEAQEKLAKAILEQGWSARLVETMVRYLKAGLPYEKALRAAAAELAGKAPAVADEAEKKVKKPAIPAALAQQYQQFQDSLVALFGTKVRVVAKNAKRGKIEIEYYNEEDLQRIYDLLHQQGRAPQAAKGRKKPGKFTV